MANKHGREHWVVNNTAEVEEDGLWRICQMPIDVPYVYYYLTVCTDVDAASSCPTNRKFGDFDRMRVSAPAY